MKSNQKFLATFTAARNAGVPLLAVPTADPSATMFNLASVTDEAYPILTWDVVRGLVPQIRKFTESGDPDVNDPSTVAMRDALQAAAKDQSETIGNPGNALEIAAHLPKESLMFFMNAQRFTEKDVVVIQAIWNLRDHFKQNNRSLVMLVPDISLPAELAQDVVVLNEPLPDTDDLAVIVRELCESVQYKVPETIVDRAVEAVRGLSAFSAEQVLAMSLTKDGILLEDLWERKYQMIENTPGLKVHRGKTSFSDIEGLANVKKFVKGLFSGTKRPDVVVLMDEMEKMMAGATSDSSGTTQKQNSAFLKWTQDRDVAACVYLGAAGSGKTALIEAMQKEFGIPVLKFNVDEAQNQYVGATGERTREALKKIDAMGERPLVICTSNDFSALPAELKSRFRFGTFFFDLPTVEENKAIWKLYMKKFNLKGQTLPTCEGWTGREIKACCDIADRCGMAITEAAKFIVPVCKSDAPRIERLRSEAHGNYISSSYEGTYVKKGTNVQAQAAFPQRNIKS
jgi:hypothetical protein